MKLTLNSQTFSVSNQTTMQKEKKTPQIRLFTKLALDLTPWEKTRIVQPATRHGAGLYESI